MNKNFKVTCALLVYGLGSGIYFANDEWYWLSLGLFITLMATWYILKVTNKGDK